MSARLGKRIRRARLTEGYSQSALADKLGVSQSTVAQWEGGKGIVAKHIAPLEKLLGPIKNVPRQSKKLKAQEESVGSDYAPSDFGIWLRSERVNRKMSVAELATKSELSSPAIYNIENGKIRSPQKNTRDRLATALGSSIPNDVISETERDQNIPELGNLTDFDPYTVNDWLSFAGVYVLYDISQRPIYVGKASRISDRLREHEQKFWFKRPIVQFASFIPITDKILRHQIEQTMIKFLKTNAVINRQSTDDFSK